MLVEGDSVLAQGFSRFVLETDLLMMLGLAANVLHQGPCLGFSDRETAAVFGRENGMY